MHLEEDSKHLTAFCTPFGVFEWYVLRMKVKVGPAEYEEMFQHVTRRCPAARPYIDDILASSGRESIDGAQTVADKQGPDTQEKYFQKHFDEVRQLFKALEAADLSVKPEKCHFFRRTVKYVGHIIKDRKRFRDPGKVQAIEEWDHRTITTPKALKGFLRLVGWYQI